MAQPSAVLFQIMEPTRLWVEALSFDTLTGEQSAIAKTSAGRILPLGYQGAGFADRNQAVPVHFRIEGDVSGLRAGQFVTVLSATQISSGAFATRSIHTSFLKRLNAIQKRPFSRVSRCRQTGGKVSRGSREKSIIPWKDWTFRPICVILRARCINTP